MYKESEILKIVKEDILEELGKENRKALTPEVKPVNVSSHFVSEAIEELKEEDLVESKGNPISLTDKGLEKIKRIS